MESRRLYIKQDREGRETLFPSEAHPAVISEYTYDAARMGAAPSITGKFMYPSCLDSLWTYNEYVEYKGEKYYVRQIPSSLKSYEDERYQHDIVLVSEREILSNEYFYDVVTADTDEQYKDRYRSNLSDFFFNGDIKEFVSRLNDSLIYTKLYNKETGEGYYVVIDEDIDTSETFELQFTNKYVSEALQEINNTFKHAYYFVGKTIHVGNVENNIEQAFEYGKGHGLLKVEKQNSNTRIVDRITGTGSSDNIPYYYPTATPFGVAKWSLEQGSVLPDVEDLDLSTVNKYSGFGVGKNYVLCWHPTEVSYPIEAGWCGHSEKEYHLQGASLYYRINTFDMDNISGKKTDIYVVTQSKKYYFKKGDIISFKRKLETHTLWKHNIYESVYYASYYNKDFAESTANKDDYWRSKISDKAYIVFVDTFSGKEIRRLEVPKNEDAQFIVPNLYTTVYFEAIVQYNYGYYIRRHEKYSDGYLLSLSGSLAILDFTLIHNYKDEFGESGYSFEYGNGLHGAHPLLNRIAYENSGIKIRNLEQLPCAKYKVEYKERTDNNSDWGFVTSVDNSEQTIINIYDREWVTPSSKLMPSIYRQSLGGERYYNAENNKYEKENGGYYVFANLYEDGNPHSYIQDFSDIKPTLKDAKNSQGQLLGEIADIAFDDNDNDEVKQSSENSNAYIHPYFYIKLHKFDGDNGFNLFTSALEGSKAIIEMTSGNCVSCKFTIAVPDPKNVSEGKYVYHNPVQVDEKGNIVAGDSDKKVIENTYQERQQDTTKNEVWIALYKEESTYGMVMPNVSNNYKPAVGDKFVITGIRMPDAYVYAAEKRLDAALIKYMHDNNTEKFNFSVVISRIYLAKHHDIAEKLNENAPITIKNNDDYIPLFVTNYSAKANDDVLEEVTVELNDDLTVAKSNFALRLQEVKNDIVETIAGLDMHLATKAYYISRRGEELSSNDERTAQGRLYMKRGAEFGTFEAGKQGAQINADGRAELMSLFIRELIQSINYENGENGRGYKIWTDDDGVSHCELDEVVLRKSLQSNRFVSGFGGEGFRLWNDENGLSNLEVDKLTVRQIMTVFELLIEKIRSIGGQIVVSAANGKIKEVSEIEDEYVITFEDDSYFITDDFMRCQTFNGTEQRGYWVKIKSSGANFVTVDKNQFQEWNTIPKAGDEVVLMGNETNVRRQNLIIISATEDGQPRIDVQNGVKEKNFNGCLRARLGNLDGIKDDWFPIDNQPHGDGLYADNAYLRGTFLLTTGEDIKTKFEIIGGKITSSVESVRKDMEDGFLRNGSFFEGTAYWSCDNNVDIFSISEKFVWANDSLLSHINAGATIVMDGGRKVARISEGIISQKQANYINIPEFEVNDKLLYEPIPVTLTFLYKVIEAGQLGIFFDNIDKSSFTDFDELVYDGELEASDEYKEFSVSGLWNGTGDFTILFSGKILIHSVALITTTGDRIAYKYRTLFEQSDKIVRIAAENFDVDGKVIEQSDIITTAKYNSLMSKYFNEDGSLVNLAGIVTTTDFNAFKKENEDNIFQTAFTLSEHIDEANDNIDKLSNKVQKEYVSIEAFAGMFATAVDENGIAKTSQLSAFVSKKKGDDGKTYLESGVMVKADNINLEGYTTINNNFHIDEEGNMHAVNGIFEGDLNVRTLGLKMSEEGVLNGSYIQSGEFTLPLLDIGEVQMLIAFNTTILKPYPIELSCANNVTIYYEESSEGTTLTNWIGAKKIALAGLFYIIGVGDGVPDFFLRTNWFLIPVSKWRSVQIIENA